MKRAHQHSTGGYSLIEIMLVVAIIGILAALAIPTSVKARKQAQARRILNDVRQMDAAIGQWAIETGQADGASVDTNACSQYMGDQWFTEDVLGNSYVVGTVGENQISVSSTTKTDLAGVAVDWGAY